MPQPPAHRSRGFASEWEPLRSHSALQLVESRISGPFNFLNPTRAHFKHVQSKDEDDGSNDEVENKDAGREMAQPSNKQAPAAQVEYRWTSRNNRKGRHQLVTTPAKDLSEAKYLVPEKTSSPRIVLRTIGKMLTHYPYWDISWLVAFIFTWGSIIWVINAFFVWLPLEKPSTEFKNEVLTGGGITAFIGATVFELGSIFLMLEAVNENHEGCFGWAVKEVIDGRRKILDLRPGRDTCTHHHPNRKNLFGKGYTNNHMRSSDEENSVPTMANKRSWTWWPSWNDLKTHYFHELGFLACSAQMFGATIFWISGFTALPGILNHLSPGLENGIYWTPQVIGGSGFIVSGTLFMIETQKKWYMPALDTLGWHIGFWNLIGGVGFTLCPAFGYDTRSWAQYQASLSTFWGSWAFLIGSLIQLYESLQKYPVEVVKNFNGGPSDLRLQADQDQGGEKQAAT
ncbi:uncharacterized protein PV09_01174 [Verruconis gallopava]|uniref:Integral membrane protein n=1 Tax=Verruconis gallopava TaxID=253628 RepID=A0A0D1Z5J2_9PEZI|nr:uncharacterized protein PV09_01174 [Verruconis gallopava]KIW08247.1 hypothetical protein PV09_01174 [Verruconis gallopava]